MSVVANDLKFMHIIYMPLQIHGKSTSAKPPGGQSAGINTTLWPACFEESMFLSLSIKICRCKRGRHRPNGSKAFAVQSNGNMCQRGEILTLSKIWANHWVTLLNCWEVFEMMSKNFPNRQWKLPQNLVKHKNKERKKERKHGSTNLKKIEMDHNNMVLFENLSA